MRWTKITLGMVLGLGILVAGSPEANAADGNSTTTVSFNQPVAIPGRFLSSGTYLFETDGPVLRIWSADRGSIYATLLTAPAYRTDLEGQDFELEERAKSPASVETIKTWFREGQAVGQELIYSDSAPKSEEASY